MHFQGGKALLPFLLAGLVIAGETHVSHGDASLLVFVPWLKMTHACPLPCSTVTAQDMMVSVMPENNDTTLGFPSMTPELKEMAKKLVYH